MRTNFTAASMRLSYQAQIILVLRYVIKALGGDLIDLDGECVFMVLISTPVYKMVDS